MTTRRQVRARRRARARVLVIALAVLVVSFAAMAVVRARANPENYNLAATRACLNESARISPIPRGGGIWVFPGFRAQFPGGGIKNDTALYFASSTDEAKSAEVPDSERMQRRRNVLTERVASASWDERVVRCLRERPRRRAGAG